MIKSVCSPPAECRGRSWGTGGGADVRSSSVSSCLPPLGADCLGLRFTWLHSVFDNFPSLLSFALKLRCTTGLCPRDLEEYGCSCRYVAAGDPVDPLDV